MFQRDDAMANNRSLSIPTREVQQLKDPAVLFGGH